MDHPIELAALGDVAAVRRFNQALLSRPLTEVIDERVVQLLHRGEGAIANIESVLTDCDDFQIPGYALRSSPKLAESFRQMGISIATLANNHIRDVRCTGVLDTLGHLQTAGLLTCGAGAQSEAASRALFLQVRGIQIGILAVAERENNIATLTRAGAAPFEPLTWAGEIAALRRECDVALVFVHAGHEFCPVPSPRIREAYRAAVDAGAHAVIGHHPHVIQGVERYRGAPIFYSLGNFCFDSDYVAAYPGWDRGLIATLQISGSGISGYELHPIGIRQGERVDLLQGEERRESLAQVEALSALLDNETAWQEAWQQFALWRAQKDYLPTFNDLSERLSKPEGRQTARIAANYFQCPTHQELMSTYFSMKANS